MPAHATSPATLDRARRPPAGRRAAPLHLPQRWRILSLAGALLVLAACQDRGAFRGVALDPPGTPPAMRVTQDDGSVFDLQAQRGHPVLVFFGYTHCPDICPTTLADWTRVRTALGDRADRVRYVFVSVDPARDTPEAAMRYARRFHPSFIGLSPEPATLQQVLAGFNVAAFEEPGEREGSYTVAHSSQVFLLDREGRVRVLFPFGATAEDMSADVGRLL